MTASALDSHKNIVSHHDKVLIVDFGSQVTQLIARRVREAGVYCEIAPFQSAEKAFAELAPKAVILSGGPCSVTDEGSPRAPQAICELNQFNIQTQLLVNSLVPPFDDSRIKKAMMLSIDRKAFIDTMSDGADRIGGVMEAPPEGVWGIGPEQLASSPGFGGDVEKNRAEAQGIMRSLGYGPDKPLKVKVLSRNLPTYREPAVLLIDQFKKIHIDGELETVESALWYMRLLRKDYNVAMNTGGSALDDPDVMLYEAYSCDSERNYTGYCDKDMQARFDQQSSTVDPVARKRLVQKIDYDLQALGVRPSIMHTRANTCWHPYVRGLALAANSQYNHWRLEDVWLDK